MKSAAMQPYLFPYIGYYQLIHAVDQFILLDNVNYINRGWINRNQILLQDKPHLFTLPVKNASQNRLIRKIELNPDNRHRQKIVDTLQHAYGKAPFFKQVFPVLKDIFFHTETNLYHFIVYSIERITEFLNIHTRFIRASRFTIDEGLRGQDRIISICKKTKTSHYINPIGGVDLYHREMFASGGIQLSFLKTNEIEYQQFYKSFVPNLSMIDILMFNSEKQCKELMKEYQLVTN